MASERRVKGTQAFFADVREKRLKGIYDEDEAKVLRKSHENPSVKKLYADFLGHPNSHIAHELLHTHYTKRGRFNQYLDEGYLRDEVEPCEETAGAKAKK